MFLLCQINGACRVTHFAFVLINPRNWFWQFLGELNWRVGFIVGLKKSAANFMVHVESTNWLWCIGMENDLAHSITLEKQVSVFVHYCVHKKLHNIWRQTYTKEMSPNWEWEGWNYRRDIHWYKVLWFGYLTFSNTNWEPQLYIRTG
jgi:hypothetical protein